METPREDAYAVIAVSVQHGKVPFCVAQCISLWLSVSVDVRAPYLSILVFF